MRTRLEYISMFQAKRTAGVTPNYDCRHRCRQCGESYLCPDRYTEPKCMPNDWEARFGRTADVMMCSPCAGYFTAEERAAWYEAHGFRETQAA